MIPMVNIVNKLMNSFSDTTTQQLNSTYVNSDTSISDSGTSVKYTDKNNSYSFSENRPDYGKEYYSQEDLSNSKEMTKI